MRTGEELLASVVVFQYYTGVSLARKGGRGLKNRCLASALELNKIRRTLKTHQQK